MNKKLLSIACLMGAFSLYAQVGIGTLVPNKSAELAVVSNDKGVLIPNLALKDITDKSTITSGNVESLLVYNTNVTNLLSVGYYYWHDNMWNKLVAEKDVPDIVINYFQDIRQGDDVTEIIKNIVRNTQGNVLYENNKLYYINQLGNKVEIDMLDETITILGYDSNTGIMIYLNEEGKETVVDLKQAIKDFQSVTRIVQDIDNNTIVFYNENQEATIINLKEYISKNETVTTLVKNSPGNYTYFNEENAPSHINVIGDIVHVIDNNLDVDLYRILQKFIDTEETVTKLDYNATTKMLAFTDEDKKTHSFDLSQIIKDIQDVTRIEDQGSKNIIVSSTTNGNILTYTLEVPKATSSSLGVVKVGSGLSIDSQGELTVNVSEIIDTQDLLGNEKIVVTNGGGSILKEVKLDINESELKLQNFGGILNLNQIIGGSSGDILIVNEQGDVIWSAIEAITTNDLSLEGSDLRSKVNGKVAGLSLVNKLSTEMIQDGAVTESKLGALPDQVNMVGVVQSDGSVKYQKIEGQSIQGKLLNSANDLLTVSNGSNSILKDVTLQVNQENFDLKLIGGILNITQIAPGENNTILVTNDQGVVQWVNKFEVVPNTTNILNLQGNTLSSTVNKASSSVNLTEDNLLSTSGIIGYNLIDVANGSGSTLKNVEISLRKGGENQVLVTRDNQLKWIDQGSVNVDITNSLTVENKQLVSSVNSFDSFVDLKDISAGHLINVTDGEGSSFKNTTISLAGGKDQQVLLSVGNVPTWSELSSILPNITSNDLNLAGNILKSTVNDVSSSVTLTQDNLISTSGITGYNLIDVVNGPGSTLKDVEISLRKGGENQVLVTRDNQLKWIDEGSVNVDITNSLTVENKQLVSSVNSFDSFVDLKDISAGHLINVTDGEGSSFKNTTISLAGGKDQQVLLSVGNVPTWSELSSITSNDLNLAGNILKSTVNDVSSSVTLTQDNLISTSGITGYNLIDVVNGPGSTLIDVEISLRKGGENQVLVTRDNQLKWIDEGSVNVDITNSLTVENKQLVSSVNSFDSFVDLKDISAGHLINVTDGEGSSFKNTTISLAGGKDQQVLLSVGNVPTWSELSSITSNDLNLAGNILKSTVNDVSSSVTLTQDNLISTSGITGYNLIDVVNGPGSTLKDVEISLRKGGENQVLVTRDNQLKWIDEGSVNVDITNSLTVENKQLVSSVNSFDSFVDLKDISAGHLINVTDGEGSSFKNTTISLAGGKDKQVLVTKGTTPEWTELSDIQTNIIVSKGSNNVIVTSEPSANTIEYKVAVNSALPSFFYMPSILIPTAAGQSSQQGVSFDNITKRGTIDLLAIFNDQFQNPVMSSPNAQALPNFTSNELGYHITYVDTTLFDLISLSSDGVLIYEVKSGANVTQGSFMNIVFNILTPNP